MGDIAEFAHKQGRSVWIDRAEVGAVTWERSQQERVEWLEL